jgi:hypothetical protein
MSSTRGDLAPRAGFGLPLFGMIFAARARVLRHNAVWLITRSANFNKQCRRLIEFFFK